MSVRVFAPAKINLTLEVGPPRADGRHPLQSAVAFADVGDWIEAGEDDAFSLSLAGMFAPDLAADADNLVLRAARALARAAGVAKGAALRLEKNLPVASGIGGGSSDAAATLKALNALWRLDLPDAALAEIAAPLGADIPVCVGAHGAWMTGAGESSAPMTIPRLHAVLVNPLRPLSTAEVYRAFDGMGLGAGFAPRAAPVWRDADCAIAAVARMGNALEAPALALMPEIGAIMETLRRDARARHVAMSGSGATVFALLESGAEGFARDCAAALPGAWVRAARLG